MIPTRCWTVAFGLLAAFPLSAQTPAAAPAPAVVHVAFPDGSSTGLREKVSALLAEPAAARAHWGIAVTALDGTPLYGLDEGKVFRPASNAKLFTTAAAMALLGPEKTFETRVFGEMDAGTGVVTGDLTLVGGGDENFGEEDLPYVAPALRVKDAPKRPALEDLQKLADQLVAKGVKRVTGKIVGDDSLFPWEPYAPGWGADDLVWYFGAAPSALTVADNDLKVTVMAGSTAHDVTTAATASIEQNGVPYYSLLTEVESTKPGTRNDVEVELLPGSKTLRVYGVMAEGAAPDTEHVSIADPAEYAALALRGMLMARGVEVEGGAAGLHKRESGSDLFVGMKTPGPCENAVLEGGSCGGSCTVRSQPGSLLASHVSAALAEDVKWTAKTSDNLHAEILLHQMGRLVTCGDGSLAGGVRMVRAFLLKAGLDGDDFFFADGSGLSAHDLVAPRATAALLAYAAKQPWFAQWKDALPVGGVDGSLASRFKDAPLKGHVFAKTGTLGETNALSGYLDAASGRQVIFSIMVDNHMPGSSADRATMDKIVAAIASAE